MKKFTLEEYLKNPDKKVITKDGRNARIVCTDSKRVYYPILALIDNRIFESPIFYTKNGAGTIYYSEEAAKKGRLPECITTVRIEWEE